MVTEQEQTRRHLDDKVYVPFGIEVLSGIVVGSYEHPSLGMRYIVDVTIPGADEIMNTVYSAADLDRAEREAPYRQPGWWTGGIRYELKVGRALRRALPRNAAVIGQYEVSPGTRTDFLIESRGGSVPVETKAATSRRKIPVDAVDEALRVLHGFDAASHVLLVTNGVLSQAAQKAVDAHAGEIVVVRWRGPRDDAELARAVRVAARAA
jgi:hypothetical protein